ncbi:hypothetical protein ACWDXV_30420 [Nocardia nova]
MVDPVEAPGRYLQHEDGSWSFVGDDGWPVAPEEYRAELRADTEVPAIPATSPAVVDVEPLRVQDVEQRELEQ